MSYQSVILSVCVPPAELPAELGVFADVTAVYSDRHPSCHSFSRWTIASQHLDALVEAFRADDLAYLRETAVVLDRAAIARAIDALESLFEQMRGDPERAIACSVYECSVEGVVDAASAPEVNPVPDVPDDDEGESLPYAIAYLKAHRLVLRHALDHDLAVVHGQSHRLDGTEA